MDSNKLRRFPHAKIAKRKKQVHPAHNPRFNLNMQLEIDYVKWALQKIESNKLPDDRREGVIRTMIKDLEKTLLAPSILVIGQNNNIL